MQQSSIIFTVLLFFFFLFLRFLLEGACIHQRQKEWESEKPPRRGFLPHCSLFSMERLGFGACTHSCRVQASTLESAVRGPAPVTAPPVGTYPKWAYFLAVTNVISFSFCLFFFINCLPVENNRFLYIPLVSRDLAALASWWFGWIP